MQDLAADTVILVQDSTLTLADSIIETEFEEVPVVSLFTEHQLQVKNQMVEFERPKLDTGFAFIVIMLCGALLVYLHRNSDGIFSMVFNGSFDKNVASQESRVENAQRSRNILLLLLGSIVSISLFIAGFITFFYSPSASTALLFFQVLAAVFGFVVIKKGIVWLLALLFNLNSELKMYHFNLNIFFSFVGITTIPLCLLLFFSPQIPTNILVISVAVLGGFLYLKSLFRGVQIALNSGAINLLHLFYYLCALEILPLFILIRLGQTL